MREDVLFSSPATKRWMNCEFVIGHRLPRTFRLSSFDYLAEFIAAIRRTNVQPHVETGDSAMRPGFRERFTCQFLPAGPKARETRLEVDLIARTCARQRRRRLIDKQRGFARLARCKLITRHFAHPASASTTLPPRPPPPPPPLPHPPTAPVHRPPSESLAGG
jgi:hypothetical protein